MIPRRTAVKIKKLYVQLNRALDNPEQYRKIELKIQTIQNTKS